MTRSQSPEQYAQRKTQDHAASAQTRGEAFRAAWLAELEPDGPSEALLLDEVCRTLDALERMEARVEADGLTTEGSVGQPVGHPLLNEIRQHRTALARLLKDLEAPDGRTQSEKAKAAARARWQKRRGA